MATYHPYHPPTCTADPSGIYAFMARIDARLDRIENQMKSTDIILGYLVSCVEEIEERLESIEENSEDIENKIDNMDSRFDDVDSKLEDIDMDVLTDGIGETIKEIEVARQDRWGGQECHAVSKFVSSTRDPVPTSLLTPIIVASSESRLRRLAAHAQPASFLSPTHPQVQKETTR